jgi:benzoylformate decarboxylase
MAAQKAADEAARDSVPLHASRFAAELAAQLPADAVIFDEALTTSPEVTRYLPPTLPGHYFQTRGGSLGVGFPGAIGLKLAHPDKTVVGFSGDGGAMYTIQALWTAAHHSIDAKFVVCNNRSYRILKHNIQKYWYERELDERDFPQPFDITSPDLDFAGLATSMGVKATRVETPDQIGPAIAAALGHDGPFLIDLVISGAVANHFVYVKGGQ